VCVPGCTVDETFTGRPAYQRAIYDVLLDHLRAEGDVHEDAVRVGVFLKAGRKFAEVRPMARALSLELVLARPVEDARVLRRIPLAQGRIWHTLRLRDRSDLDDQVLGWSSEARAAADDD
jgi:carbohydrate-selective porin OprB